MNFYKHHIGDYDSHTSHLTWLEDTAYSRLMRLYYRTETPPPRDLKAVCRLVRATGKAERDAVEAVLNEFFTLEEDGWHNARCDAEIGKANAQAETNRQIAEAREARKRATNEARIVHEPSNESCNESFTITSKSREPSQTPDSRLQTPEEEKSKDGAGAPVQPIDPIKSIFDRGIALIGGDAKSSRSFIGGLRKKFTDLVVIEAIARGEEIRPSDPIPWLLKACETGKAKTNGHTTDDWLTKVMAGAENGARA